MPKNVNKIIISWQEASSPRWTRKHFSQMKAAEDKQAQDPLPKSHKNKWSREIAYIIVLSCIS